MSQALVVNASPVITLAKAGLVDLLPRLGSPLVIPRPVADEVLAGPGQDPARLWLLGASRDFIKETGPMKPEISAWDLGSGESSVLSWAMDHSGFKAVLDDRMARKCAETLSIPMAGTLGVVLLAHREGLISDVRLALEALGKVGLYISTSLLEKLMRL